MLNMRYAIRKRRPDLRRRTCGFSLRNNEVLVIDLSFHNVESVKNVVKHGYCVRQTNASVGTYQDDAYDMLDMDGEEVTLISIGVSAPRRSDYKLIKELEGT